ncbi:HAMP domain-containing histidine kinase [Microbispora tritici]|uniref:histidine kinase n=2 Tax=Microbispora TaxID=2005 RepID=A0ABY3LNS4_9ACTN|nr:HAMP domain-containing histidine kinase [Microbispora fusca]TYB45101.1 HAMP domain-containing histidine kinase [Microbispora tritici]
MSPERPHRTLRRVNEITRRLDAVNRGGTVGRVPEPYGYGPVSRLGRSVNGTLARLDDANRRLRELRDRQRRCAADLSHELRTPLTALRTRLEDARSHPDDASLPALLEQTLGDVDRLESIVTDLLLLTRLRAAEPGSTMRLDLGRLVRDETSLQSWGCSVHLSLRPGVVVEVAEDLVRRALANLLDNAVRHARTRVRVEVRHGKDTGELLITDDGDGIPHGQWERVFDPFYRLDAARSRAQGGPGLGLTIAREIAEAHGGGLQVRDSSAPGAFFLLWLPLAKGA